ncbi:MAG: DNA polymerase III subunit gamma/tau [Pyrinomonadaceae bacterium]|nr:DNA polymerase III subunit gamma/tau [Pyrinomonadaceae bacterium]
MSYQVIARKWRPQVFEEVIGQEAITQTLRNAIEYDRLHHAYLFSGARGVGKTTTARLLAKALNCHKTSKPNPTPCDTSSKDACPSCLEVSESRSIDVLEFDAASHTKVDEIREIILESINVNPARDRYKIFIIDEVHMLSKSSFNALLKTLEEPPENVIFTMATTEKHKVPETILSRVQEFEFRTIPLLKIYNRLKTISEAEKIEISEKGLKEIARSGEGSMRDAQSNFDQVISFSGKKIETEDVINALGIASAEMLTKTITAISEKNSGELIEIVKDLVERGHDLRHFCTDLITFVRDLLVFKMVGETEDLLDTAILSADDLQAYSAPFSETDLIRFFNSIAETESNLRDANEPRYLLEIGLVKLIEMRRVAPIEDVLERLRRLESAIGDLDAVDPASIPAKTKSSESLPEGHFEKKTLESDSLPQETSVSPEINKIVEPERPEAAEESANGTPAEALSLRQKIGKSMAKKSPAAQDSDKPKSGFGIDLTSMPVKSAPLSDEDLEHVDDLKLDREFEDRLIREGDTLQILIDPAATLGKPLKDESEDRAPDVSPADRGMGTSAAAAPAKDNKALEIVSKLREVEEIDENIPTLTEEPTEDELFEYAENHPKVRKVMRVFRGKIVEVKKKSAPED